MKKILYALVGMFLPIVAQSENIELAGLFFLNNKASFSLYEVGSGKNSGWVSIGDSFEGYRLESYNQTDGVLRLTSSDDELSITLRPSSVGTEQIEIDDHLSYERQDSEQQEEIAAQSKSIELAGLFFLNNEARFSLYEVDSGKNSGWVSIGDSFEGYRLESYNRTDGILRLTSLDDELLITLRPSSVGTQRIEVKVHLSYEREDPEQQEDSPELQEARVRLTILRNRYRENHPAVGDQKIKIRELERQDPHP